MPIDIGQADVNVPQKIDHAFPLDALPISRVSRGEGRNGLLAHRRDFACLVLMEVLSLLNAGALLASALRTFSNRPLRATSGGRIRASGLSAVAIREDRRNS